MTTIDTFFTVILWHLVVVVIFVEELGHAKFWVSYI